MSRAVIIDAARDDVVLTCGKHGASISVIETLPSGVIRVVFKNADAAAIVTRAFKGRVITEPVERTPLALGSRGVPLTQT